MKIVVLLGSGESKKQEETRRIKQQFLPDAVFLFDLSVKKISDIDLAVTSLSLFEVSDKLIVIENTPDDLDLKKLVKANNPSTLLFLASSPRINSKLLSSAKEINAKTIVFEAEKEISAFPYLDNLIEGKKEVFGKLQELLDGYGGMYIFAMIYYLLRRNFLPLPSSSFMKDKIKSQKQQFSLGDWQKLYYLTLETDFAIKSGILPEKIALTKLTQEFINYTQNIQNFGLFKIRKN